jgi:DNA polymerase-3 subunit delta'
MAKLTSLAVADKLPSSLLFVGPKGTGKWIVANELAKVLLCEESKDGYCGRCYSCRQADSYSHPDIHYLFPLPKEKWEGHYYPYLANKTESPFGSASASASNFIIIDSIRKFESKLARKPSLAHQKVGIINEAERMLPAVMDSLLKTLEEPSADTYLIVITDQPRFLPQTIISRLMRVNFGPLPETFISDYLREKLEQNHGKAELLTRFANGNLYNADLLIEGDYLQTRESAVKVFTDALTMRASDIYAKYESSAALESREKVEYLLLHWQGFIRDLVLLMSLNSDSQGEISDRDLLNPDLRDKYRLFQSRLPNVDRLSAGNLRLEGVRSELRRNVNPQMAAFSFLFELCGDKAGN